MSNLIVCVQNGVSNFRQKYNDAHSFKVGEAGQLIVTRDDGGVDLFAAGYWLYVVTPPKEDGVSCA